MIQSTKKQQLGISMLGWTIILSMVGLLLIVGLKLLPVYLEYYKVVDVMNTMGQDTTMATTSKKDIEKSFKKRLGTNEVRSIKKDNYKILKVKGRKSYAIQIDYSVETHLFSNLSIVARFERAVEIGAGPTQ